jgi:hypothetical protein
MAIMRRDKRRAERAAQPSLGKLHQHGMILVRSFIAFAKRLYPQQLLYLAMRAYIVNEDSQALLNLNTRSRLSGQLERKHSFLPHLVLMRKLKKYDLLRNVFEVARESASAPISQRSHHSLKTIPHVHSNTKLSHNHPLHSVVLVTQTSNT